MGSILATPNKTPRDPSQVKMGKEANNNSTTLPNIYSDSNNNPPNNNNNHQQGGQHHKTKSAPFSKFHIVQECFPNLSGKENKFFNEKVPSYWSKQNKVDKQDSKKKNKQQQGKTQVQPQQPDPYTKTTDNAPANKRQQPLVVVGQNTGAQTQTQHGQPIQQTQQTNQVTPSEKPATELEKYESSPRQITANRHSCSTLNLSETLKYIGCYVYLRCRNLEGLKPSIVVGWIRSTDRSLVVSGWQEQGFISQPNMMVLYMLLREVIPPKVRSIAQLKATIMSALYMCYAYNGHEISYPLKPFLIDNDRAGFWDRCMDIIAQHSGKLLRVNKDPKYYNEIQIELKTFGRSLERRDR